jgi:hypothetical protein
LLLHLADETAAVATKDLGARLSNAGSPDVTARKAKADAEKQLLGAGIDAADVATLIVADGKKGYRLGLAARVI